MSQINVKFRQAWNAKFPDLPCWVDPSDDTVEYRPIKAIYDSINSPEKTFRNWVKSKNYSDCRLDFCLNDYQLCLEIDGADHIRACNVSKDRRKCNMLTIMGWTVLRFDAMTVINSPELVEEAIIHCLINNFKVPNKIFEKYKDY